MVASMKRALILLLLLASGCSLSYQHGAVALGKPAAAVKALLGDLRQPTRITGEGLKAEEDEWVRIPEDDPSVAYEIYTFTEGKLKSLQVAYAPDADPALLGGEVEGKLGSPDVKLLGVSYFEKEGGTAIFTDFGKTKTVTFYFTDEEGEEEAVEASFRCLLLVGQKTSYRFLFLGACLLLGLCAIGSVLRILLELQGLRKSIPAIRSRADLDAFRRIGYRHKLTDVVASVLLLLGGASVVVGVMAEHVEGTDILLALPIFLAYAALGKSYSSLGKSLTKLHPVQDPEQQEAWDAWLEVMNTPLNLDNARALAREAGA
jgi:hypothetical protein